MSTTYTPTPTALTTITLPQDVVDDVVVATVNPPLQDLANAVALSQLVRGTSVRCALTAGSYALNAPWGLTADILPVAGITVGATSITVTNTGVYFVAIDTLVSAAGSFGTEVTMGLEARANPYSVWATTVRYSANNALVARCSGSGFLTISAGGTIVFRTPASSGIVTTECAGGSVSVMRVR